MDNTFCLIYHGEILEGFAPEEVRKQLAALFKLDESQVQQLFSGQRSVLKRALPAHESQRYLDHFRKIGARVHLEAEHRTPAPAPAAPAAQAPAAPTPLPQNPPPVVDGITCPKCGEYQPKRTLCRACAVDMPRYQAAQEEAEAEARAARLAEKQQAGGRNAPSSAADSRGEAASLLGIAWEGRIGRLSYNTGTGLSCALLALIVVKALPAGNALLFLSALVLVALYCLRLSVLRCHDLDHSGALSLLLMVPVIGVIFTFVLALWPGSKGDNRFGERPRSGSLILFLLAGIALLASYGFAGSKMMTLIEQQYHAQQAGNDGDLPAGLPPPGTFDPKHNRIQIYGTGNHECERTLKRSLLAMGIEPEELFTPLNPDDRNMQDMLEKVRRAGLDPSHIEMPLVDVNGHIVPGGDLNTVISHLRP